MNQLLLAVSIHLFCSLAEFDRRHSDVNAQVAACHLQIHDVLGDGNCMFRAAAFALHGSEEQHAELRAAVVCNMVEHTAVYSSLLHLDNYEMQELIADISEAQRPAGEAAILALCNTLHREIRVFTAYSSALAYQPTNGW